MKLRRIGSTISALLLTGSLFVARAAPADSAPTHVFVVNTQDASVSLVELATLKEVRRFTVGPRPYGVAVSRDGGTVAVGVEDEEKIKFYDTTEFKPKGEVRIGRMFNDHLALTPDGRHFVLANFYSDDVVGIDAATLKEAFRIKGASAPHVIKYGPLKKHAYVTCKKITGIAVVDPAERKLVQFHQLNVNPRSLTFSPDESKLYFGSFWVDGFFEMDAQTGKVTRLFAFAPPPDNAAPQEVTYHGVESVAPSIVLAANEGRSYVEAVDVSSGKLLDRLAEGVSKPCCIERIPGQAGAVRVLVSNIGDGTLQLVEMSGDGKLQTLGKVAVGKAPKRVAFFSQKTSGGKNAMIDFNQDTPGEAPRHVSTALTGSGNPGKWVVLKDGARHVLAQTDEDATSYRFPLAIFDQITARDADLSVKFKPVSGKKDQAAGLVWRLRDKDNYYIVRANALENNVVLYKMQNGKREDLPLKDAGRTYGRKASVPRNEWSELRVTVSGKLFTVYLNGVKLYEVEDETFPDAGKVALWTKADSVTYFDELKIAAR
jgi:YVTN family beta-propeller protein